MNIDNAFICTIGFVGVVVCETKNQIEWDK